MRTIFSIFGQYSTKGPIELDASLAISFEDIQKKLFRSRTYEEIRALMEEPDEDVSLVDLLCFVLLCVLHC